MNDELDRVVALVEDSRVWRVVAGPRASVAAAWQSSVVGRVSRAWSTQLSSWPVSQRIRFVAVTIACATACHAAILQVVPPYARPAIPLWWLALVIAVATITAAFADAIPAAWAESAMARLTRPIASYWSSGKKTR